MSDSEQEPITGGFVLGLSLGLFGLGVWGTFTFQSFFLALFALMGFVMASMSVTMVTDRDRYRRVGIRVGALGGWIWMTLMWADLITRSSHWILPEPFILALFGLASGGFMVSTFQHVGWIDGPLLWGSADGD